MKNTLFKRIILIIFGLYGLSYLIKVTNRPTRCECLNVFNSSVGMVFFHELQEMEKKYGVGELPSDFYLSERCVSSYSYEDIKGFENLDCSGSDMHVERHSNGQIKAKGRVVNGKANGNWKFYDENGVLLRESYFVNDELNGEYKEYHSNGQINSTGRLESGKANGKWKYFNENGTLIQESYWENDLRSGKTKYYYDNGNLKENTLWENGVLTGEAKFYLKSGKPQTFGQYKNGKKDGNWMYHDESGVLDSEVYWENDVESGDYKEYFDNGNLKMYGLLFNGKQHGKWVYYHKNEQLKKYQIFEGGSMINISNCHDNKGALIDCNDINTSSHDCPCCL